MSNVLYSEKGVKDIEFQIVGDIQAVIDKLDYLMNVPNDEEEYGRLMCTVTQSSMDDPPTEEQRQADIDQMIHLKKKLLEEQFKEWFDRIPRKKNGTFAKGRIVILHAARTYSHYLGDSYGWNTPEVVIKTIDDTQAELQYRTSIYKY